MSKSSRHTLIIFLILLICWIPYMVMCFPGNIAYDAGTGISWYLNLDRTNPNNPWFQNLLMGFFYSLGSDWNKNLLGIALYCFLQAVLTALLLAKSMVYIRNRIRCKKAAYILPALYALIPAFPLYAFSMNKDSSFALVILYYEYLAMQAICEPEAFRKSKSKEIGFCLAIVMMGLMRNNAGYLPAVAFLVYSVIIRQKKVVIMAAATLMAVLLCALGIPRLLNYPTAEVRENLSLPIQTTAYYLTEHPDDLTEEEQQNLAAVMPFENWINDYQADISDPLKTNAKLDRETTGPFMGTWMKLCLRHPLTMLKGWYQGTYGYLLPWVQTTVKDHAIVGNRMNREVLRTLRLNMWGNALENNARNLDEGSLKTPVINILAKIGLYSLLLVITTVVSLFRKKRKFFLCLVPLVMVFLGCLLSPVNGYYRYAFPYILSMPLLFLLVSGEHTPEGNNTAF